MPKNPALEIPANALFRPKDLEELLGRRCVEALRGHGLRAVGDWYLGKSVLDAFERAVLEKTGQRVPTERKVNRETEHGEGVEEDRNAGTLQPVPERNGTVSLASQIESLRRLRSAKVPRAKPRKRTR